MVKQRQDYYNDRMSGLRRDTKVLQWILGVECPQVARVLKNLDVGLDLFIGKWLLCWFVETLPLEVSFDELIKVVLFYKEESSN
ncbi:unnamed protein product [Heligmosomoides polygyrus]|uniref:Rab-GAP TBC domain-containing protein n=1 Tax=Heligmosomoides polygyrus TaxID=6339 RepID=A0A183F994_HELPZ|nr:unnamed protein product [Heligmosomoides polygyrus]